MAPETMLSKARLVTLLIRGFGEHVAVTTDSQLHFGAGKIQDSTIGDWVKAKKGRIDRY